MLKTTTRAKAPFPSLSATSFFPQQGSYVCTRCLHSPLRKPPVPPPVPFVPDHTTFLKLIGRSSSRFANKINSWDELFRLSSADLRSRGIEPTRDRRYLLRWREKYRKGEFGIGGDMRFVSEDGTAWMKVVELPKLSRRQLAARDEEREKSLREAPSGSTAEVGGDIRQENTSKEEAPTIATETTPPTPSSDPISTYLATNKIVLNFPEDESDPTRILQPERAITTTYDLPKVRMVKIARGHVIRGAHIQLVKGTNGSVATLKAVEGLWEHRRGHKVDGGERRKAEVRFKRAVEERKKARV